MILMSFDWLPPSANHAYFTIMSGSGRSKHPVRVLTNEGKKFKRETSAELLRKYPQELRVFKPDTPYAVHSFMYFPNLLNSGWPEKAQTRYKRLDADNRLKLFLDSLKDAAGVDDSSFMDIRVVKDLGPERTDIYVWNMEEETLPIRHLVYPA